MKRKNRVLHLLVDHLIEQKSIYLFVSVLFLVGVVFGAVIVNTLDVNKKTELLQYLQYFFQGLARDDIADPSIAFQHSIGDYFKMLALMWILGLSVIGIPVMLVYLFFKGLVTGFTIGFLINQLSWKGLWFAVAAVIPINIVVIPVLLILSVAGIQFSITLVKNRFMNSRGPIYPQFVHYSLLASALTVCLLLVAATEAYVSPVLMKNVIPFGM
ncbi:stage II sporulation protein M [Shimazuella alba]|jgi:stage II sporulation protein M|uniref:Stage II sporulation protein M n=1 Tax=Shimazuella alba TaxID=2690964 RepID=A0A6I4VMD8_9BACL|nr:stage II sporulation protein M [Shimazuella alba]MXQ52173.1 stage II sporulation protein M [Shimazuella alba]